MMNAEVGSEAEVLKKLKKTAGVKEAYLVYGVYDIVAKVEAETMKKLREVIASKIRGIDGVGSTLTMIVIEGT